MSKPRPSAILRRMRTIKFANTCPSRITIDRTLRPRSAALAAIAFCLSLPLFAQEYSFTPDITEPTDTETFGIAVGAEGYLSGEVTSREFIDFSFNSEHFGFVAATSFHQDDDYAPDIGNLPGGTLFGSYFLMDQGGLVFRGLGMELQAGRLEHHDVIDSPYSLFISSKRLPANIINFRYENAFAFYETRWIELNKDSAVTTPAFPGGFPDRGAQLKTYGVKVGTMRFGFQDAAVYSGKSFDLEYLLSPMPNYLIQYVKGTAGRPWTTGANENDIMGFFWDWEANDELYFNAQILLDDVNVFGIGNTPLNPWKAAYSLGARLKTDYGTFSFHHALATKFVYERSEDIVQDKYAYSYTYYPDTRFALDDGYASIAIDDMMVGYYNGENNIAFRLDYDHRVAGFDLSSSLEFTLSGPKSPTNAWHESSFEYGTKLLDYSILEKKLAFEGQISRRIRQFVAFMDINAGVAVNALELQAPYVGSEDEENALIHAHSWIWRPGDETQYYWSIGLGLRYDIPVMNALRP